MKKTSEEIKLIENSGLFDSEWYLANYPNVAALGIAPVEHYLHIGALTLKNPGPNFDTKHYLKTYPDVMASKINPLIHYITHGTEEGRHPRPHSIQAAVTSEKIDIVVPVFNALEDTKLCLSSISKNKDGFNVNVFVVNDGSDDETTAWLREWCSTESIFNLIEHESNFGYTVAINTGLKKSSSPYVITLNSDTIVTPGWLKGMIRCAESANNIGIVGPLSNAASWQSVPVLWDEDGTFCINKIPENYTANDIAAVVAGCSQRIYPRVPIVNGFCFMISRQVIDAIGIMDDTNFPLGYGEENDFCIRASDSGFDLAIADDVYVFHAKSKSFGHNRRAELSKNGNAAFIKKHSKERMDKSVQALRKNSELNSIRNNIYSTLQKKKAKPVSYACTSPKIVFLLPVPGGGGGAHSIVQEVNEMRRLGFDAKIGVRNNDLPKYIDDYSEIKDIKQAFIALDFNNIVNEAGSSIANFDIAIATIYSSIDILNQIVSSHPHVMPGYYIQDYEPLFFYPGSDKSKKARDSYEAIPNIIAFAKTHWITRIVKKEHNIDVEKVEPSIDHSIYFPDAKYSEGKIRVSAMIRPSTPYRGAKKTMAVFSRLAEIMPDTFEFKIFGCNANDDGFLALNHNFNYENFGILTRPEVASVLRSSDIFVDLSDYQAFGRTSLEAMACGCVPLVPQNGGSDEYAIHGFNSFIVNTESESDAFNYLASIGKDQVNLKKMQREALRTASRYSVTKAAVSEVNLLIEAYEEFHENNSVKQRNKLIYFPDVRGDMKPTGSGYVRIILPYWQKELATMWRREICIPKMLPKSEENGKNSVAILQRKIASATLDDIKEWFVSWRKNESKVIFDIDDDLLDKDGLTDRNAGANFDEVSEKIIWVAKQADAVTVSTKTIFERMSSFNDNVFLIPNYLDETLWELSHPRDHYEGSFSRKKDVVTIGYIGTPTHKQDLEVVQSAINRIEAEYGSSIKIEVIGAYENMLPLFGEKVPLPRRTEYPKFVEWLLKRVHWDIGIIPLKDDNFNRSKSNLKFIEYAALDMAIVCSDVLTYRDIASHDENCLVAKNEEEEWYSCIKRLIDNSNLRQRLASSARSMVSLSYTTKSNISKYNEALNSLE